MNGKICAITGANSGIGYETALALAQRGAELILICRTAEKGEAAREAIIAATQNKKVHLILCDLSIQAQIREASRQIVAQFPRLDVLLNNAAMLSSRRRESVDGYELQLAVNHLAPFLLTHCLLPVLNQAEAARILNVSSNNHYRAEIGLEDLQLQNEYHILKAYGRTKLANLLFTYELDRRLKEKGLNRIEVYALDPGFVNTDIGLKHTSWLHRLAWSFRKKGGLSPKEGAATQIYLATAPEVWGQSGTYWANQKPKPSSKASYERSDALELWVRSLEMCGLEHYFESIG